MRVEVQVGGRKARKERIRKAKAVRIAIGHAIVKEGAGATE